MVSVKRNGPTAIGHRFAGDERLHEQNQSITVAAPAIPPPWLTVAEVRSTVQSPPQSMT